MRETKVNKIAALQVNLEINLDVKPKTSVVKRCQARTKVISDLDYIGDNAEADPGEGLRGLQPSL